MSRPKGATPNRRESQVMEFLLAVAMFAAIGAMLGFGMLAGVE
jgi:hypothetical protein